MTTPSAGRFLLRLVRQEAAAVEYQGEFEIGDLRAPFMLRVALPGGAVEVVQTAGPAAPPWLVDQARAALRTAFRSSLGGTPWPRRIHRFRSARQDDDDA